VVLCNAPLRSFVGPLRSFAVFSHTPNSRPRLFDEFTAASFAVAN